MRRFLLDANISPRTGEFLRTKFAFDVIDVISLGLPGLDDFEIVEMAKSQRRAIITEDLDFGRLHFRYQHADVGIIVLRLRVQSAEAVNRALERFFSNPASLSIPIERSLVVIDDARVRVASDP